jgi:hypothetical protein
MEIVDYPKSRLKCKSIFRCESPYRGSRLAGETAYPTFALLRIVSSVGQGTKFFRYALRRW